MPKIPTSIITGFLGSGKTSLLKRILKHDDFKNTAVIINEYGKIGLDHFLIEHCGDNVYLMANGCLCCIVQNDLINTLTGLILKKIRGEIPAFDRLIIETSGLAEPSALINSLYLDVSLNQHYLLNGIVTVVDNLEGPAVLEKFAEARKQLIFADLVIQTKLDLVKDSNLENLIRKYTSAKIVSNQLWDEELIEIIFSTPYCPYKQLNVFAPQKLSHAEGEIQSHSFTYDNPIAWDALTKCLEALLSIKGQDIYRIKGIVNIVDERYPYAIHGTQHIVYPPERLHQWPDFPSKKTQLVFIVKNTAKELLQDMLDMAFKHSRKQTLAIGTI